MSKEWLEIVREVSLQCCAGLAALGLGGLIAYLGRDRDVIVVQGIKSKGDAFRAVSKLAKETGGDLQEWEKYSSTGMLEIDYLLHEAEHGLADRVDNLHGPPGKMGYKLRKGKVTTLFYKRITEKENPEREMRIAIAPLSSKRCRGYLSQRDRQIYKSAYQKLKSKQGD